MCRHVIRNELSEFDAALNGFVFTLSGDRKKCFKVNSFFFFFLFKCALMFFSVWIINPSKRG